MNRNRQEKGITLIALVITIVIILILAGVAISLTIGENGLFNRAKESAESYKEANIREKIETEIAALDMDKVSKGEKLTVEQALIELNKKEIFEEIDEAEKTGFIRDYIVQLGTDEKGNVIILEIENDTKTRIVAKASPKGYTNGKVEVEISARPNGINITNLEIPEGMTEKEEGIYEIIQNGSYLVRATLSNGETIQKKIEIAAIDTLQPKYFTITAEDTENGILINAQTEDEEAKEGSVCSGIEKYEYYYKLSAETEYRKNEGNLIKDCELSEVYNIYVLAYDKAGNIKGSNLVEGVIDFWNEFQVTRSGNVNIVGGSTLQLLPDGNPLMIAEVTLKYMGNLNPCSKVDVTYSAGYDGPYNYSVINMSTGEENTYSLRPCPGAYNTISIELPKESKQIALSFKAGSYGTEIDLVGIKLVK